MHYRPASFRKSSRPVVALAAAALFATAAVTATSPASAEDGSDKYIAACAHLKDGTPEHAGCIISQLDQNTRDLRAQQKAAEKDIRATAQSEVCFDFLQKGKENKLFTREAVLAAAGGRITTDNACPVAIQFGFGKRASAEQPRMQ